MKRILVIDDDEQICAMLRQMLSRAGHLVDEAPNGDVGIRLHRASPYDLIITDIFMPEREGLETIRELRNDFPDAKIIAMSGGGNSGELSYLSLAKSFGAQQAIVKPFNRAELLECVEKALEGGV